MRTKYGEYAEYHTSKDDKDFISFEGMAEAADTYFDVCQTHEMNRVYENTIKYCEPQLGPRGLYPTLGTRTNIESIEAISWFLNLADGKRDLIEISRKSGVSLKELYIVAEKCVKAEIAKYK
jgi:aminopeptidase-like protein